MFADDFSSWNMRFFRNLGIMDFELSRVHLLQDPCVVDVDSHLRRAGVVLKTHMSVRKDKSLISADDIDVSRAGIDDFQSSNIEEKLEDSKY